MDFGYLLSILLRRKWLILGAMLTAAAAAFVWISMKPQRYKSTAIVATGIVNYKGINSDNSDAFVQQYQVDNAFSNLIEITQSRSAIKILTIDLLKHDLAASSNSTDKPFRTPKPELVGMSQADFSAKCNELLPEISKINLDSLTDPSFSQQFDYLLDRVARAWGYDHDAVLKNLSVKRKGATDYLSFELITESPALSRHMANTYATRFIRYYQNLKLREKRKNVETLSSLAAEKKAVVDSITEMRFLYLKQKGLPALGKQSEELVAQIAKLEIEQQRVQARKKSAAESVDQLDRYMRERSSRDANETRGRVVEKNSTDEQFQRVRELTQRSLETGGKDADVEAQLAEAKQELESSVRSSAKILGKQRSEDSKKTREDLYKEKVSIDMDRIEAEESSQRLSQEIWALKNRLGSMAASDEISSKLEADENRALKEFEEADAERIKAKMSLENVENPLSIVENAQMPEWPEPNRRMLISAFAALVAGTLTAILLFVLAYMDTAMRSPELFKRFTDNLPLMGVMSVIPVKGLDFNAVFTGGSAREYGGFRENVRKIRSSILQSGARIFLIVSAKDKEGKTFVLHALAYSLAANNKKVLMLDTNFKSPLPEAYANQPSPNSALLNKIVRDHGLAEVFQLKKKAENADAEEHFVDILGNAGLHGSPSELLEPESFRAFLQQIQEHYDYVLMESASLNRYSDAQELLPYTDRVIAVFNARSAVRQQDKSSLQFLRELGSKFAGSILTEVDPRHTA